MLLFSLLAVVAALRGHALYNPILPGFNPDPSMIRVGSDFFVATSTFELFPGNPIYHSTNLVDWELIGHATNRASQLSMFSTPSDGGIWAPTLRYHEGTFYLVSTARYVYTPELRIFPRSFFVTTNDIFANSWSDPIYFDSLGYDPDLFWDKNGDVYSTWCGINNAVEKIYGIYQNKIDITTGDSLTDAQLIFNGTLPNDARARPEGPHVYLIDDTYYLLIAEGGTSEGHRATIQRGPSPSGPWEDNPNNPLIYNGADPSLPVQATGHADMVQTEDGTWYGCALGVRPQGANFTYRQLGRESYLFPITWEDGWPIFNGGKPLTQHLEGVLEDRLPVTDYYNDFSGIDTLDLSFYSTRTPYKPFHTLTARPGYLRIKGNGYAPGDRDSIAMLMRKQTSYNQSFETLLEFSPTSNLTEAGISIFTSDQMHNEIAVVGSVDGSKRSIITRKLVPAEQVGPWALTLTNNSVTTVEYHELNTPDQPIRLTIIGNSTQYTFGYAEGDSDFVFPLTFDSLPLSAGPVGTSFYKGASFAIYNTGNGMPTLSPADFKYWKQTS